jgi:hypothetical protein
MKFNTYEHKGVHYVSIIKDNGGVLIESSGDTLDAAIHRLCGDVQFYVDVWTRANYILKLMVMSSADLFNELKDKIKGCLGNNNPVSDFYWQRDAARNEAIRRSEAALYDQAWYEVNDE